MGISDVYLTGLENFSQLCILQIPTAFTSHIFLPKEYLTKFQPNQSHRITCRDSMKLKVIFKMSLQNWLNNGLGYTFTHVSDNQITKKVNIFCDVTSLTLGNNALPQSSRLKMEATHQTFTMIDWIIQHHIPEDSNLHSHHHQSLNLQH